MKLARLVLAIVALAAAGACSSSVTGPAPDQTAPSQPGAPALGIGTYGSGG